MPDPENVRFRGADLRGANLEGASLADADLSEIRTGMRTGWIVAMCALALAVSIGLGVLAGLGAKYLGQLLESGDSRNVALALNAYAALAVLIVAALWKGGDFALRVVVPVITAMFLAMTGIAVATGVGRGAGLFVALGALFLGTAVIALGALARAVAGTAGNSMFVAVAVAGGLAGGLVG